MEMTFIFYLLLVLVLLGIVAYRAKLHFKRNLCEENKMYYDEDGNHRYYERSLIEKLHYMRKHPECQQLRSIRGLLFYRKN